MSKKDFVLIARAIASAPGLDVEGRMQLASHFADHLASTNGRFDRRRFTDACVAAVTGR